MAGFEPYLVYTPLRTTDNQGGFTESLVSGTGRFIWGVITIQQPETAMIVDAREAVLPDDVIMCEDAQYRVVRVQRLLAEQMKSITLVRIERPIEPL
jgi:hypothetical protein